MSVPFVRLRVDKSTPAHTHVTVFAGPEASGGNCGQLVMRHEEFAWLLRACMERVEYAPLRDEVKRLREVCSLAARQLREMEEAL